MSIRAALAAALVVVASLTALPAIGVAQETEPACSFPVSTTDATGTVVTVETNPGRVVALGPSAAQTLWELEAREQVVGLPVQYTSDLEGADERADVMNPDGFTINVERVVNLTPDLVLAPNIIPTGTVETLRDAGLTVYKFRFAADLADVVEKTRLTGQLTGNCGAGDRRADRMAARLEAIRSAVEGEPRPSVVYPLGGGFVAGNGTFLHEIIVTAGGRNLAAEAGVVGYGTLSVEVIVTRNPDWLVLNEGLPRSALQLYAYNHTTAIKRNQVVRVNPNYANQPAPRVVLVVEAIARAIHPDVLERGTPTPSPETPEPDPTTVPPTTATEPVPPTTEPGAGPTETPGQPGFGACLALVVLLGTLLLKRAHA